MNQEIFVPGKFYRRPCIRTVWPGEPDSPRWLPILGPLHEDREIINFPAHHYHVDFRFLHQRDRESDQLLVHQIHPVYLLTVTTATPVGAGFDRIRLHQLPNAQFPAETYLSTRKRRFSGAYPPYPNQQAPWLEQLHHAYQDAVLKDNLVCPHRGADLSGLQPDQDNCLTCPLHGLRWSLSTGQLAPAADLTPSHRQETLNTRRQPR